MFRGVYTATAGMLAAQRYQEVLSHNLSNAQTPGFKQDQTILKTFPEMLLYRLYGERGPSRGSTVPAGRLLPPRVGSLATGVYAQEGIPNFSQGPVVETGRALDLAIVDDTLPVNPDTGAKGTLFFAVQVGDEIRYMRNGQLALDQDGYLTTAEGYYVLDENLNPIYVGNEQFQVTPDGFVILDELALEEAPAGVPVQTRLWLGYTEQPQHLVREGNSLWRWAPDGEGEAPFGEPELVYGLPLFGLADVNGTFAVRQGYLEQSNVDLGQTMTQMLMQYRLYEANQRVLQAYDRSMELAANQIGRLF